VSAKKNSEYSPEIDITYIEELRRFVEESREFVKVATSLLHELHKLGGQFRSIQ
jgi:hypothetical protein